MKKQALQLLYVPATPLFSILRPLMCHSDALAFPIIFVEALLRLFVSSKLVMTLVSYLVYQAQSAVLDLMIGSACLFWL